MNKYESAYFNVVFEKERGKFDFTDKKVGFIAGSNGRTLSNKGKYFDLEKERFTRNSSPNNGNLHIFDAPQKEESGGLDAAIMYWNIVSGSTDDAVRQLNKCP